MMCVECKATICSGEMIKPHRRCEGRINQEESITEEGSSKVNCWQVWCSTQVLDKANRQND